MIKAGDCGGRLPHALLSLDANLSDETLLLDDATPESVMYFREDIEDAICIGISTMIGPQIKCSLEVAQAIRSINPHVPLVWGGWHPSLKPEQTLENRYVDKVVIGQGEQAFHDVVENIKNGNRVDDITAYDYIDKGQFPIYNFDKINMRRYIIPYISPRTISLFTSQGCPHRCAFCAIDSLYGTKKSGWKIEQVVELIAHCVRKYKIDGVHFDDDNFFIGKKRALEFANLLLRYDLKINWSANARVDILHRLQPDEWEILDRSGCKRLHIGAESGEQAILDKLNKGITIEMIWKVAELCDKFNIIPWLTWMVGVPFESKEDIEKTFKLVDAIAEKYPLVQPLLFIYTPYPETPLFDLSLQMGYKEPQTFEGWGEHYLYHSTTPWVDESLEKRVERYNEVFLPRRCNFSLKHQRKAKLWPCLLVSVREELSHELLNRPRKQRLRKVKWYLKELSTHKKEYLSYFVRLLRGHKDYMATKQVENG